jgi:hypothetical protein
MEYLENIVADAVHASLAKGQDVFFTLRYVADQLEDVSPAIAQAFRSLADHTTHQK